MPTIIRAKKWRDLIINLVIFAILVLGIRTWQQRDMISGTAPDLQGVTLAGIPYQLPSHPPHPLLVHFWASWCPICNAEQSTIAGISHNQSNVISIAMQSGKSEEVTRYMRDKGLDFPVINDPDGRIAKSWGVNGVPTSFVIGTDGKIRFIEVGYTSSIGLKLRLWLAKVIDA